MRSYLFIFSCLCLVGASLSFSAPYHHHHHLKRIKQIPGPTRALETNESAQERSDIHKQTLAERLAKLEEIVKKPRNKTVKPLAYLTGSASGWVTYERGEVMTDWNTETTGVTYPSVFQGGMTYSDGYITVPETGIYYIYFTLYAQPAFVNQQISPYIAVDSLQIGLSQEYPESEQMESHYLGKLWKVEKGSRLSVVEGAARMRYFLSGDFGSFGAWKVD